MITDTNSIIGFFSNSMVGMFGDGAFILIGILFFLVIAYFAIVSKARTGTMVMIGASIAVMFSFIAPEFGFLFWIAILVAGFVLINGLRKWITGQ
jgi:hypothetical protein